MTDEETIAADQTGKAKWRIFLLVGAGVFLSTMDSSMVNVALPSIMRSFSAPLIQVQWVVLIYLLTITVSLLLWGVAADRLGTGRVYLLGIGVFGIGSLVCALSPTIWLLIGARLVEGLGAAMMMASGPVIIRDAFPRRELGKGIGMIGIATSAGLMSGPLISGLLINSFSWRMIFLVTLPVSLVILVAGISLFRTSGSGNGARNKRQFDGRGAMLWAVLVVSFILYAHFLPSVGWLFRVGGALWLMLAIFLFVWTERTRTSGILPLHLFGKSYFHIGLITAAVSFGALFVVLVLLPFYLDYVRGLPANLIGLVMMAVPLSLFVVSPVSGMIYDRLGGRVLTTAGLAICFVALLSLALIDAESSLTAICGRLALLGMGQSMFLAPNTASLLSRIEDDDAGVTAGLLATSRNLGMLSGAAFAGIVFAGWFAWFTGGAEVRHYDPVQSDLFIAALRATFLCASAISLVAVLISWQRER
jgi:EmrB/QacA subfamily drug resistance transporter